MWTCWLWQNDFCAVFDSSYVWKKNRSAQPLFSDYAALDIDYEMAGKDLIDSVVLARKICSILGKVPPQGMITEHFLDEQGGKISKSIGNGLSIEDWLAYGPQESLAYFMYLHPERAKRLSFDIIPKSVDEYARHITRYTDQPDAARIENPLCYIGRDIPMAPQIEFTTLLNLVGVCATDDIAIVWKFITRYKPHLTQKQNPLLDRMVECAVRYYKDVLSLHQKYRLPTKEEKPALMALRAALLPMRPTEAQQSEKDIENLLYTIGKEHFADLKHWFSCLYEVLLGQTQGPRMASFIMIYGIKETCAAIDKSCC